MLGQPLAVRPMTSLTKNDALKGHLQKRERVQQHIHSFAPQDLPCINNEISPAETAAQIGVARTGYWRVDFDSGGVKAVLLQFLPHVMRNRDHSVEFLVERDLFPLIQVADVLNRKPRAMISSEK